MATNVHNIVLNEKNESKKITKLSYDYTIVARAWSSLQLKNVVFII